MFILTYGCVTIVNREMKSVNSIGFIYDKANGDVARLEWVGDAFNDDANFGIDSVGLVLTDKHRVHWKKSNFLKLQ